MPISEDKLRQIALQISEEAGIKVDYYRKLRKKNVALHSDSESLKNDLINLLERRPCTEESIKAVFGNKDMPNLLSELVDCGILERKKDFYFVKQR